MKVSPRHSRFWRTLVCVAVIGCLGALPTGEVAQAAEEFPGMLSLKRKDLDPTSRKLVAEETRLMNEIRENDSRVKRTQLAWTRYDRAVLIMGTYQETKDVRYYNAALELVRSATELAPHIAAFWRLKGSMALMNTNGVVSDLIALGAFRHVVRLNPLDWDSRRILAEILYRGQHFKAAIVEYDMYLSFNPGMIREVADEVAMAFIQARRTRDGLALLDRIEESIGASAEGRMARAVILRAQRKHEDSLAELRSALDLPSVTKKNRRDVQALLAHWKELGPMIYED